MNDTEVKFPVSAELLEAFLKRELCLWGWSDTPENRTKALTHLMQQSMATAIGVDFPAFVKAKYDGGDVAKIIEEAGR